MIWVRLIGGIANNQVVKVDPDQVQHIAQDRLPVASFSRSHSLGTMSAEVRRTAYTRRSVHTPRGDIIFFAAESLSDHEALQSVLGP